LHDRLRRRNRRQHGQHIGTFARANAGFVAITASGVGATFRLPAGIDRIHRHAALDDV
jgi:hypothetical protein